MDCASCGVGISEKVRSFSVDRFGKALCRDCQASSSVAPVLVTDKDLNDRYNFIKGRIAEALIEELFQCIGFKVYRFGMENTMPEMRGQLHGTQAKVTTLIRSMPDFVIQEPGKDPFLVEVKFRASGELSRRNLAPSYPYPDALVVLVSKRHIKAIEFSELDTGAQIEAKDHRYLGRLPQFRKYRDTIIKFCEFAVKFFESVPEPAARDSHGGSAPPSPPGNRTLKAGPRKR